MGASQAHLAPLDPAIHLAPPTGWMNDPNGLSYFDNRWHAYYQHNPHDDVWGPMHWRHATTADLVSWTDQGIALAPCDLGTIFSGSVVVDETNTAGFGPGTKVAIFTLDDGGNQRQGVAWSADGYQWTMSDSNPVLVDPNQDHFRDPKVFRFDDSWTMVLGVGAEIRFYRSDDLVGWRQVGAYRPEPTPANPIECPDLIETRTLSGDPTWVLIFGDDRGGRGGHGTTVAVPGSFDGNTFKASGEPRAVDQGPDFYAAQSFYRNQPGQPPILMAWMNSWPYANSHPSAGRRGVLSVPRRLVVDPTASATVRSYAGFDLDSVFTTAVAPRWESQPGRAVMAAGTAFDLTVQPNDTLGAEAAVRASVSIELGMATIERSGGPGLEAFDFQLEKVTETPGPVRVLVDHGTVEVLTADGQTASMLVFPGPDFVVEAKARSGAELNMRCTTAT